MMKKYCPQCGRRYDDSQQRVCLTDGALLSLPDPYRLVGSTLDGKYRIDALVGIGGFGVVYSSYHLRLDRRVAFKILKPDIALQTPEAVGLFESEAKTAARLHHENIVTIHDAGRTNDDISYIAMEWLEGRPLDEELNASGRLSFERTGEILRQMAAALVSAHAHRTVHRDLKPSNVMLVKRPGGGEQVKVVDFGIAKVLSSTEGSMVSRVIGTPHYAAPEQLRPGTQIDGRADIYAFGVMLYQMLTGRLPFTPPQVEDFRVWIQEWIRLKLNESPPPLRHWLPDAPAAVERLLMRMIAREPDQRPHIGEIWPVFDRALSGQRLLQSEGQQAFDAGEYEVAIAKWEEALRLSPNTLGVKENIKVARRKIQEEAVRREKVKRLISEGKQAFDAEEDEMAIAKWKEVLAISPGEPGVNEHIEAAQQAMKREAARQQREGAQRRKEQEREERRGKETEEKRRQQEETEIREPIINIALYAQTDVGMVASGNEDNFLVLDLSTGKSWTASEEGHFDLLTYSQGYYGSLLAISDGIDSELAGELASRMAIETVRDRMLQLQAHSVYTRLPFHERLRLSIEEANLLINGESQTNPAHRGLRATFTAVAVRYNQVYFAQVGNSRAYLIRQDRIYRITKDQTLVQQLVDAGQITEEEAEMHSQRSATLQSLGAHSNVDVEVNYLTLCNLDTLVLCSYGLWDKMHQRVIARVVIECSDFKSACQSLIDLANDRGGEDNVTVVIAQFSGSGLTLPTDDSVEPQSLARSPDTPTEINWSAGQDDPF